MNIGLCDDEPAELETLHRLVKEYSARRHQSFDISLFPNGESLISSISAGKKFDILFLDIYLGGADGIAVAREIRKADKTCCIIFATTSRENAIAGYGVRALQYLLKPLDSERIDEALDLANETLMQPSNAAVQIQNRQGVFKIPLDDIVYAESNARVITVNRHEQSPLDFYGRLDDFERQCGDKRFLRCHKSYLVNLDYVHAIVNNCILLETGEEIRFSMNISAVKESFAAHTASKI